MRLHDIKPIHESRGFVARRPGDEYVDMSNRSDIAIFTGLTLLPSDGEEYENNSELLSSLNDFKAETTGKVYEINKPLSNMKAAMIVNMDTQRGPEHYILYTNNLNRLEGKLTNIPPGVIRGHGGYVMNKKISHSERSGLKPGEVLKSNSPVIPSQVPNLLNVARSTAGDEAVTQMQDYLKALANGRGNGYVIEDGAQFASLHEKYLGEWAAPIAFITGQFSPSSQMSELEENMTDGQSLNTGKIIYNTNARESLFDSTVAVGNNEILISSKASKGGGAAASLKGLHDAMTKKADKFPRGFWDDEKNARFRDIVQDIMDNSSIDGVFEVAKLEGLIDQRDETVIRQGLSKKKMAQSEFAPTQRISDMMSNYAAYTHHPDYHPAKHAMAGLARAVVNKLNDEDFTDTIKQILNNANVIQMYFETTMKGKDLIAKGFKLVWPPRFDGKIKFDSVKSFSATEAGRGKLCFKIGTGAYMVDKPDDSLMVPRDARSIQQARKAEQKARDVQVGKITNSGERDVRDVEVPDVVALGRQKKS